MDKLINSICEHFKFTNPTRQKGFNSLIGIIVTVLFWTLCADLLRFIQKKSATIEPMDDPALHSIFFVIQNIYQFIFLAITIYCIWYALKYLATFFIELLLLCTLPSFKDPTHSIQALMTSMVTDELRLHNEIVKFLTKNKTAKDYAVLHIWLHENGLICTNEQKAFLEALSTDKGTIDIISTTSLCDAETTVQTWINKSKNGGELSPDAFPILKKYHDLDKLLGVYRIA